MIDWSLVASQERVDFFENPEEAVATFCHRRRRSNVEWILVQGDQVAPFLTLRNTLLARRRRQQKIQGGLE